MMPAMQMKTLIVVLLSFGVLISCSDTTVTTVDEYAELFETSQDEQLLISQAFDRSFGTLTDYNPRLREVYSKELNEAVTSSESLVNKWEEFEPSARNQAHHGFYLQFLNRLHESFIFLRTTLGELYVFGTESNPLGEGIPESAYVSLQLAALQEIEIRFAEMAVLVRSMNRELDRLESD